MICCMRPRHTQDASLTWKLFHGENLRFLPRQGEPISVWEWSCQLIVKCVAFLPVYTAIIVTLVLLVQLFGLPFK